MRSADSERMLACPFTHADCPSTTSGNAKWTPALLDYRMPKSALPPQPYESTLLLSVTGKASRALSAGAQHALASGKKLVASVGLTRTSDVQPRGSPESLPTPLVSRVASPRRLSLTGVSMVTGLGSQSLNGDEADASEKARVAKEQQTLLLQDDFLRPCADVRFILAIVCFAAVWLAATLYAGFGPWASVAAAVVAGVLSTGIWLR